MFYSDICFLMPSIHRVTRNSVNPKYSIVLTGIFRFKLASRFVESYHSVVSCVFNKENSISDNFYKFSKVIKTSLEYLNIQFTNQLTDFLTNLYILPLMYDTKFHNHAKKKQAFASLPYISHILLLRRTAHTLL